MKIKWEDCHKPIDDAVIRRVESALHHEFPEDYRRMIARRHGGCPEPSDFSYDDPDHGRVEGTVGELLSFDAAYEDNILLVNEDLAAQLPSGIVAITHDGGGNFVAFDYRRSRTNPAVVYWLHDKPIEKSVVALANSWTEFLDQLHEPED
jgi:cell wall assembly regulator SMI1